MSVTETTKPKRPRRKVDTRRKYTVQTIYANPQGDFAFLEHLPEWTPPEEVGGLPRIGTVRDLLLGVIRGRNQMRVAAQLEISPGAFNGYVYKPNLRPVLPPSKWRQLIAMYYEPPQEGEAEGTRHWKLHKREGILRDVGE